MIFIILINLESPSIEIRTKNKEVSAVKVLSLAYKDKSVIQHRVNSPLVLVGRSPLCDMVIRTPGINSVHFILEWIGTGEFNINTCSDDEWVITLVSHQDAPAEKKLNKTATGEGFIFYQQPIRVEDYTFQWQEDRLVEADLSRKIISQQVSDLRESGGVKVDSSAVISTVLEVICLSQEVDSVNEIFHYNLNSKNYKVDESLSAFQINVQTKSQKKIVNFQLPTDSVAHVIRQGQMLNKIDDRKISIEQSDLLHVEWDSVAYYFRIVPRVAVPIARKSIFSDPFYVITSFCLLIGAIGFYFMLKNIRNQKPVVLPPPRIAEVQVLEVAKPPPIEPEEKVLAKPNPEEKPPEEKEQAEKLKKNNNKEKDKTEKPVELIPNQMPGMKTSNAKNNPVTQSDKGGLKTKTESSKANTVGFLSAFKTNKKLGLVKADQIVNNGAINHTVSGDKAEVLLDQSAQGMVNKYVRKDGENLAAASTGVNLNDKVGMNSLSGKEQNVLKDGFNVTFGEDGGGGGLGSAVPDASIETSVEGGLDKVSVKSAISGYKNEIRTCYERALRMKSSIGGRVSYKFLISNQGDTQWVQILKNDVDSSTLVACVQGVIKLIKFPKAKNGQSTIVIYPFQFTKKGS